MIYPWQNNQWQRLQNLRTEQHLPHAILLSGADGLGKAEFAMSFAHSLLCQQRQSSGEACGTCASCHLIQASTHPDFLYLAPEDDTKAIKVDDIRGLCAEFFLTSQYGGYKVAVIHQADNMNINAANSLLKTLEEPNDQSILILVSSKPHRLPITIRSRCQTVAFQQPDIEQSKQWLASQITGDVTQWLSMAHGSPLLARYLAQDEIQQQHRELVDALLAAARSQPIINHAEKLSKLPKQALLGWLYDWISDLLKLIECGNDCQLINLLYRKELTALSLKMQSTQLYTLLDQVIKFRKVQSIPLNSQMLWEDLLISWEQLLKRA